MSQATTNIVNQSRTLVRQAIIAALQAQQSNNSGLTAPTETYAYMWWADTTTGILKQRNSANTAWVSLLNLTTGFPIGAAASGANTDITSRGNATSTVYTSGGTATAYTIVPNPAITAYTAGQAFEVLFSAASGLNPTLQINGIATPPSLVMQQADGTYINAVGIPLNHRSLVTLISATQALVVTMPPAVAAAPNSRITVNTANGYGSTNTMIRRFTTVVASVGGGITYTDSATLGGSFTINTAGTYAVSYNDNFSGSEFMGISLNTTQPATSITGITVADRLAMSFGSAANVIAHCSAARYFPAGSVIRAHTGGTGVFTAANVDFTIARMG